MRKKTGKGVGKKKGGKGQDGERRGENQGTKADGFFTADCSGDDSSSLWAGQKEAGESPPPAHSLG